MQKVKARMDMRNALTAGKLEKLACEICGDPKTHGHHTDYAKALDVRWLCATHHMQIHRKYNPIELPPKKNL